MRFICTFLFFIILASCTPVLWPFLYILCTFLDINMMMMYVYSSPISTCVVSFPSLYTCFFLYAIFISVSHMMPWWVLFKCFRKTGCESLSCYELSSCKVFQEFMLRLDLFCNPTSGYEFSDLRPLSWFSCLLWFCHGLPKGEIVRNIFDVNWLILWQKALYF